MTILCDHEIAQLLEAGRLKIIGYHPSRLQPASVDLLLGEGFIVPTSNQAIHLDGTTRPGTPKPLSGNYLLRPGGFVLATTAERVTIPPDIVARVEGKSSLGRIGLCVHATAGFIDPGFEGQITLELFNMGKSPIVLYPGHAICQIAFQRMGGDALRPYGHPDLRSHYQGQTGVTPSRGLDGAAQVIDRFEREGKEFEIFDRVYHRRADLFGSVQSISVESFAFFAMVKYEFPYDSKAEPVRVPLAALVHSYEAPTGDG